jgi:phosphoglycerate dehydrogenase-like enzyme
MKRILIGYPLNRYKEFNKILHSLSRKYEVVIKDYNYRWLKSNIQRFEIIIPSVKVMIDKSVIEKAKNLKLIFTPTTGCDHIEMECCPKTLRILSLNDYKEEIVSVHSTAELGFTLLLNLSRRIILARRDVVEKGRWNRNDFLGRELAGKVIGIIGLGRIGQKIASYAEVFGMKIIYWDEVRYDKWKRVNKFRKFLSLSDFVVVCVTFDKKTYHFINMENIGFIKKGAILINVSRGKVVEEEALCRALKEGYLSGVGVDVLEFELENFRRSPLWKYARQHPEENVVITPHIGGATIDAWGKVFSLVAEKILEGDGLYEVS